MSAKPLTRTNSLRKPVRPLLDIDEEDDNRRRDSTGRKRVPVVQCLLDTSDDENLDEQIQIEKPSTILWLTFIEICHIRQVLTKTSLIHDKQAPLIRNGRMCFQCRTKIDNGFFFFSLIFGSNNHEVCYICQQIICKKCSNLNFIPPTSTDFIPVRIQTLIKLSSVNNEKKNDENIKPNPQSKTVCHCCLQIFNEHIKTAHYHDKPLPSPLTRTYSLPPMSSAPTTETRHVRHRRRPGQSTNSNTEKPQVNTPLRITPL